MRYNCFRLQNTTAATIPSVNEIWTALEMMMPDFKAKSHSSYDLSMHCTGDPVVFENWLQEQKSSNGPFRHCPLLIWKFGLSSNLTSSNYLSYYDPLDKEEIIILHIPSYSIPCAALCHAFLNTYPFRWKKSAWIETVKDHLAEMEVSSNHSSSLKEFFSAIITIIYAECQNIDTTAIQLAAMIERFVQSGNDRLSLLRSRFPSLLGIDIGGTSFHYSECFQKNSMDKLTKYKKAVYFLYELEYETKYVKFNTRTIQELRSILSLSSASKMDSVLEMVDKATSALEHSQSRLQMTFFNTRPQEMQNLYLKLLSRAKEIKDRETYPIDIVAITQASKENHLPFYPANIAGDVVREINRYYHGK